MATIQVKHVPDDVHHVLQRRARAAGKSLQEYLLGELCERAREPSIDEWIDEVEERADGRFSVDDVVGVLRADRESH